MKWVVKIFSVFTCFILIPWFVAVLSYRLTDVYFQIRMIPLPFESVGQWVAVAAFLAVFGLMHLLFGVVKVIWRKGAS